MASKRNKPVQNSAKAVHKTREPEKKADEAPPIPRTELQVPHAVGDLNNTNCRKERSYEWVRLGVEVAALIAAIWGFVILYWTLDATRESATAAQRSAEAAEKVLILTERPWVSVKVSIVDHLKFVDLRGKMIIQIGMKNVGQAVAVNVKVGGELTYVEMRPPQSKETMNSTYVIATADSKCRRMEGVANVGEEWGIVLFPQEEWSFNQEIFLEREEVEAGIRSHAPYEAGDLVPLVIVCAIYRFPDSSEYHRTQIPFALKPKGGPIGALSVEPKGEYPHLELIRSIVGAKAT